MAIMSKQTVVKTEEVAEDADFPKVYVHNGQTMRYSASDAKRHGLTDADLATATTEKADPDTKKRTPATAPKTETPDVKTK